MRTSRFAAFVTAALALVLLPIGQVFAQPDPGFSYVDVNNDGLYNPEDGDVGASMGVDIDELLASGYFHTQISQGDYVAPPDPASLVVLRRLSNRQGVLLVAGMDLAVAASVSAGDGEAGFYAGGDIAIGDGVKVFAGDYVNVRAGGNVTVGEKSSLKAGNKDSGAVIVQSEAASLLVGNGAKVTCGWLCDLTTDQGGGSINIGENVAIKASKEGDVNILSADELWMTAAKVSGDNVTLQSHSSDAGRGEATGAGAGAAHVLNSKVTTPKKHGTVRILAEGKGSLIDLTGTVLKAGEAVELQADTIIGN